MAAQVENKECPLTPHRVVRSMRIGLKVEE